MRESVRAPGTMVLRDLVVGSNPSLSRTLGPLVYVLNPFYVDCMYANNIYVIHIVRGSRG